MADIEFVMEVPQATRVNKKRPRLVTSCDHCRLKKIKCVQQTSTGTCEACVAVSLPCLYRDREQYFAERSRMLSGMGSALRDMSANVQGKAQPFRGPSPTQSSDSSSSSLTDLGRSGSPSFISYPALETMDANAFQPYSDVFIVQSAHPTWDGVQPLSGSSSPPPNPNTRTNSRTIVSHSTSQMSPMLGLFDEADQHQPHRNLMTSFLHVFFDKLGSSYPFLPSDVICNRFVHHQLSPLLANSIAASAARFSTLPEIMQIGPANAADVYCQFAKSLVPPENAPATIDVLHALILLAWAECKRGRQAMFSAYARYVTRLTSELGISEESLPSLTRVSDPHTVRVLHATWQCVKLLERTLLASELVALSGQTSHPHPHSQPPHHRSLSNPVSHSPAAPVPSFW